MIAEDVTEMTFAKAMYAFLTEFSTPELDLEHIMNGFENDVTLPPDGNDFAVFRPLSVRRRGTNSETYEKDPDGRDIMTVGSYQEMLIQVDFYSKNWRDAQRRAQTIECVARSSYGPAFFNQFGLDCLYADEAQNLTAVMDSRKFVSRWSLILHVGHWKRVEIPQDFFTTAAPLVTEVGVKFKP